MPSSTELLHGISGFPASVSYVLTLLATGARTDGLRRYQRFVVGFGEHPQGPDISVKQNAASM